MHDDHDNEHDHGEPYEIGPNTVVEDIEGLEMFTLRSVGIDIGSSTSHLVFSHLTLRREGASHSARFRVTDREVLYRSKIMLTPYLSGTLIDTEKVKDFIHLAYREAGFTPDDIDTGAVVITGEALKKENARPIVEFFAKDSGKFICASAGPNHEALLAAYGSGAVDLSKREKTAVLNVDMGGGTTKFSLIQDGIVGQTASINIGARLIAFDDADVITRVEDAGRDIMKQLGYSVALAQKVTVRQKEDFAALMAEILFEVIDGGPTSALARQLMVTEPFKNYRGISEIGSIVFSGGVSEHIYDHDRNSYGDVGPLLGKYVREQLKKFSRPDLLREPNEGIRATVIGAGEYTIQASGTTSYISSATALPAFGLKVIRVSLNAQDSAAENLRQGLAKFDLPAFTSGLALAFSLDDQPDYQSIRKIAEGIVAVVHDSGVKSPVYLALDIDVAKSLGAILKEELRLAPEVIAVDGIDVGDLDYIDIGVPMGITEVIPVTVKSLMFPSTQLG